jgi:hypothetical protein
VFTVIARDADRTRIGRPADIHRRLHALDALLDLADAGEVFVQFAAVAGAQFRAELDGILGREIQDALVIALTAQAFGPIFGDRTSEQALEDQAGIDFLGRRRRLAAP